MDRLNLGPANKRDFVSGKTASAAFEPDTGTDQIPHQSLPFQREHQRGGVGTQKPVSATGQEPQPGTDGHAARGHRSDDDEQRVPRTVPQRRVANGGKAKGGAVWVFVSKRRHD